MTEDKDAMTVIAEALAKHHPRIALACSFQAEDIVVLDMMCRIEPSARVFAIDTGRLHEETYALAEKIRHRYAKEIEWVFPDRNAVEALVRKKGLYSFRESVEARKECCHIRKVEPLLRALKGLEAWITGLRRGQSVTRELVQQVEVDNAHNGLLKYNPIVHWTTEQVWAYVRERGLPYHPLYERGYTQLGCAPCTSPVLPGEDPRAGRWRWESGTTKECGLHIDGSGI